MNPDFAGDFTVRSNVIYERLPPCLSQIYLYWRNDSGYRIKFYCRLDATMTYMGRRPNGYFGDLHLTEITPEMILPRFPRVLKRFKGAWLAEILKSEVGTDRKPSQNQEAKAAWWGMSQEMRDELKGRAIAIAGPEGYLRDPHAIALLIKGMMDHGVPIKNPILIGEVLKEIAGRKL